MNSKLIVEIKKELKEIEKDVLKIWDLKSTSFVCQVWCKSFNARYDGYNTCLGLNDKTVIALIKKHLMEDLLKIAIDVLFKCMEML